MEGILATEFISVNEEKIVKLLGSDSLKMAKLTPLDFAEGKFYGLSVDNPRITTTLTHAFVAGVRYGQIETGKSLDEVEVQFPYPTPDTLDGQIDDMPYFDAMKGSF